MAIVNIRLIIEKLFTADLEFSSTSTFLCIKIKKAANNMKNTIIIPGTYKVETSETGASFEKPYIMRIIGMASLIATPNIIFVCTLPCCLGSFLSFSTFILNRIKMGNTANAAAATNT